MDESIKAPQSNGYENVKHVKRVDRLEIESLPKGEFTKLFIELVENGIGRSIEVPVVVLPGAKQRRANLWHYCGAAWQ